MELIKISKPFEDEWPVVIVTVFFFDERSPQQQGWDKCVEFP